MIRFVPLAAAFLLAGCAGGPGLEGLRADKTAFRAVGANPNWSLTADTRVLTFESGGTRLVEPASRAVSSASGRTYQSASMRVTSNRARCALEGDGTRYPEQVTAVVNGRSFTGCGGPPLAADALEGSEWRVLSVRGQSLPAGAPSFFRFDRDRFSARFGCNSFGGRYAVTGIVMSVGQVASTRTTCPDMSAEQDASAILGDVLTVIWNSADRLTLSSPKGAIVLVR